jgi:hypothetical protein
MSTETKQERKDRLNRERQQRFRDRQKLTRDQTDYINQMHEEEQARRSKEGKCFLGEVRPGVDANNVADALQVAREMARALAISDVVDGESLLDFERRTFEAWGHGGGPFLNRNTQQLSAGWGDDYWLDNGGFDATWSPLPGCDAVIDVRSLPELPSRSGFTQ